MAMMAFTPQHAAMGGLLLAISTAGKCIINGRILGIAGSMKGMVQNDVSMWRVMFLGGMIVGSLPLVALIGPSAFDAMPETCSLLRMAMSGFLVGYGASMANGCTSGHCISGNARLSIRSLVFTIMFMSAGVVSASLTATTAALGFVPTPGEAILPFMPASTAEIQIMLGTAAAAATTLTLIGAMAPRLKGQARFIEGLTEFTTGFIFSLGLGFCGMSHPTKLAGFLSPFAGSWDPSLVFVMGSAVVGSALVHQSLQGRLPFVSKALKAKPVLLEKYVLPSLAAAKIDSKLIIGGILFGLGVGGSGLCPGPDIVNIVANYSPQVAVHLASMLFGLFLEDYVSKHNTKTMATRGL